MQQTAVLIFSISWDLFLPFSSVLFCSCPWTSYSIHLVSLLAFFSLLFRLSLMLRLLPLRLSPEVQLGWWRGQDSWADAKARARRWGQWLPVVEVDQEEQHHHHRHHLQEEELRSKAEILHLLRPVAGELLQHDLELIHHRDNRKRSKLQNKKLMKVSLWCLLCCLFTRSVSHFVPSLLLASSLLSLSLFSLARRASIAFNWQAEYSLSIVSFILSFWCFGFHFPCFVLFWPRLLARVNRHASIALNLQAEEGLRSQVGAALSFFLFLFPVLFPLLSLFSHAASVNRHTSIALNSCKPKNDCDLKLAPPFSPPHCLILFCHPVCFLSAVPLLSYPFMKRVWIVMHPPLWTCRQKKGYDLKLAPLFSLILFACWPRNSVLMWWEDWVVAVTLHIQRKRCFVRFCSSHFRFSFIPSISFSFVQLEHLRTSYISLNAECLIRYSRLLRQPKRVRKAFFMSYLTLFLYSLACSDPVAGHLALHPLRPRHRFFPSLPVPLEWLTLFFLRPTREQEESDSSKDQVAEKWAQEEEEEQEEEEKRAVVVLELLEVQDEEEAEAEEEEEWLIMLLRLRRHRLLLLLQVFHLALLLLLFKSNTTMMIAMKKIMKSKEEKEEKEEKEGKTPPSVEGRRRSRSLSSSSSPASSPTASPSSPSSFPPASFFRCSIFPRGLHFFRSFCVCRRERKEKRQKKKSGSL